MTRRCTSTILLAGSVLWAVALWADDESRPWAEKAAAEWTEDDAKLILTKSPWAKQVTPDVEDARAGQHGAAGRGGSRRGGGGTGVNVGGIGIGLPIPRGRYPGGGYPGGGGNSGSGGQRAGYPPSDDGSPAPEQPKSPLLTLRWERALPVQQAELKDRVLDAPTIESKYYAVVVFGLTRRLSNDDSGNLKKDAALQRDGKKDIKPDRVEILPRDEGPVVVYLFSRAKEIARQDGFVTFDAHIGRYHVVQSFAVESMIYNGKLEI